MASTWSLSHWHSGREMESENHNRFSSSCHLPIPFQRTTRCHLETGGNGSPPRPLCGSSTAWPPYPEDLPVDGPLWPVPRAQILGRPVQVRSQAAELRARPAPLCGHALQTLGRAAAGERPLSPWRWLSCSASSLWGPLSAWNNREDTP